MLAVMEGGEHSHSGMYMLSTQQHLHVSIANHSTELASIVPRGSEHQRINMK